ncbi:hypothetical protein HDV00_006199 [Rhizophlyctis rosea]|nr:hypothetical protein HDV00_006199 [Rhizophlyctis rosea]
MPIPLIQSTIPARAVRLDWALRMSSPSASASAPRSPIVRVDSPRPFAASGSLAYRGKETKDWTAVDVAEWLRNEGYALESAVLYSIECGGAAESPVFPFILDCPANVPGPSSDLSPSQTTSSQDPDSQAATFDFAQATQAFHFQPQIWAVDKDDIEKVGTMDKDWDATNGLQALLERVQKAQTVNAGDERTVNFDKESSENEEPDEDDESDEGEEFNKAENPKYFINTSHSQRPYYSEPLLTSTSSIVQDPLSKLYLPTCQTPHKTLFSIASLLPPSIKEWVNNVVVNCFDYRWDEEEEGSMLARVVALGLVVEKGLERKSLGVWFPHKEASMTVLVQWGRRRNVGRRIVGFMTSVSFSIEIFIVCRHHGMMV